MSCKKCDGTGVVAGENPGEGKTCPKCDGAGFAPVRRTDKQFAKEIREKLPVFRSAVLARVLAALANALDSAEGERLLDLDDQMYREEKSS